ncbi:luciferin 4-monooxygenase [Rhipicephalus sanguineus]|uniref:luciferin 4-monooxygenase n=1 Tax=Rhipicephalus sanguineus TaxID=34632 RepID=UPI001895E6D0|nr:luciferin 4-monooxygenase [Rhipicephalus sanguineus]
MQTELPENETPLSQSPDTTLCIIYSSGTTGLPKGVELTHRNIIAQVTAYRYMDHVFEVGDSFLCSVAFMHIGGFWSCFCYLGLGCKVVLCDATDVESTLSAIQEHKPTTAGLYPTTIRQLDQCPNYEDFDTSSLTKIIYGGGSVSVPISDSVIRKFGLKEIVQVYGMTELTSCLACSSYLDDLKSVGKPAPFFEIKVVDFLTRKPLGPNQQGEVCAKSPAAFKAYLNQPKATADAYEDGFVRTGDKGYYTEDGSIFLCGRFKELIKCMDQQVYPAELEELLASDPEVRHVIVAGVPHSQYVEAARAFVVHQRRLTDPLEQQKEAERLKKLVADRLAHHKQLHGGLEFLDCIPESEYGKHARKFLRERYIHRCHSSDESGNAITSEND